MAWSRYGRRYRRYRKYRRFYRRYRRGYSRRYVNASSRSSVRMKTAVTSNFQLTAGYGNTATGAVVRSVVPFGPLSTLTSASSSPLYLTYCNLYEEVKCIGMKVNLAITDAVGVAPLNAVQIYTAWDRRHGASEGTPTADEIKSMSTVSTATAVNNNVAKISRSIYASDLIEKSMWIDSSVDSVNYYNTAWNDVGTSPYFFCPSFFVYMNCPNGSATSTIHCTMSVVYYFAFRNPKFGATGSSKVVDLGARPVDYPDEDDGDMDDGVALRSANIDDRVIDDVMALPDASDSTARRAASLEERRNAQRNASRNARRSGAPIVVQKN